jgi:hypothetical protein
LPEAFQVAGSLQPIETPRLKPARFLHENPEGLHASRTPPAEAVRIVGGMQPKPDRPPLKRPLPTRLLRDGWWLVDPPPDDKADAPSEPARDPDAEDRDE